MWEGWWGRDDRSRISGDLPEVAVRWVDLLAGFADLVGLSSANGGSPSLARRAFSRANLRASRSRINTRFASRSAACFFSLATRLGTKERKKQDSVGTKVEMEMSERGLTSMHVASMRRIPLHDTVAKWKCSKPCPIALLSGLHGMQIRMP